MAGLTSLLPFRFSYLVHAFTVGLQIVFVESPNLS